MWKNARILPWKGCRIIKSLKLIFCHWSYDLTASLSNVSFSILLATFDVLSIWLSAHCTGLIILGGGIVKHHTLNANMMRDRADYSVYFNTAFEFDGGDSGASPDEALSWGKICSTAKPVKVTADASIVSPLLVTATFAKDVKAWSEATHNTVSLHAYL